MNIGIAGAGLMGRWHASAARAAGARLVGVADPDRGAAQKLASRYAGASAFESVDELLRQAALSVLHVCTPLASHGPIARQAIQRGVSVLIEKPLLKDAAATERLLAESSAAGALVCPVHQFPFQDGFRAALAGLPRAGELRHVDMVMCSAGGQGRDGAGLRELEGEMLPHPLSLAQALLPGGLDGVRWSVLRRHPGELRVLAEGEVSFHVLISLACRPTENALTLRCTGGTWHVDLFHGFAFFESGAVSRLRKIARPFSSSASTLLSAGSNLARRSWRREPAYPGLRSLVREFHRAVSDARPTPIAPEETLGIARTRDALLAMSV